MADDTLRSTPLFDRHVALGAKIIPFAGWEMPVQYSGIIAEHNAVRNQAGLFDLGHMGQVDVAGPDALAYLQAITTNDVSTAAAWRGAIRDAAEPERGGVIDDILIYRRPDGDGYMVVVNAANHSGMSTGCRAARETPRARRARSRDISDETGMIAIQGPNRTRIVQSISGRTTSRRLPITTGGDPEPIAGVPVMVARTGYTGEDGFEIYGRRSTEAGKVWDALMAAGKDLGLQADRPRRARHAASRSADAALWPGARATTSRRSRPVSAGRSSSTRATSSAAKAWPPSRQTGPKRKAVGFHMTERSGAPRTHYPVGVDGDRHRRSDQWCVLPDIRREYRAGAGRAGVRGRRQAACRWRSAASGSTPSKSRCRFTSDPTSSRSDEREGATMARTRGSEIHEIA